MMMNSNNEPLNDQEEFNINADENLSGTEHLNDPIDESQLEALEAELNESKDKYIRLAAEFDNFRKRTAKERVELFQTAGKEMIVELLPVLDDIERASQQLEQSTDKNLKEGITLIFNKFKNVMQSKGLKAMEVIGNDFDPEYHDAITEIPAANEGQTGKIVDEISKGYYLNDKIIRHAKVVVGK